MIRVTHFLLLFAIVFLVNGIVSLYFLSQTQQIISAKSQVIKEVDLIDRLQRYIINAETAQRGYLLTGERRYLEPFFKMQPQAQGIIRELYRLQNSGSVYGVSFSQIKTLQEDIALKFNAMLKKIEHLQNQDREAAYELMRTDQGRVLMQDIKEQLGVMREAKFTQLDRELTASKRSATQAFRSVLIANFFGFGLLCWFALLQRRAYDRSENLNERLEEANASLEDANVKLELTNENLENIVDARTQVLEEQAMTLTKSNQELESFAYVASHDLQEPLRKIRAFGDRLQERYGDRLDERGLDYLARMRSASERMSTLISDLLSLSRAKSQELVIKPVSLNQVFKMVVSDMNTALQEAGGEINVAPLPVVYGDAMQLLQIFSNLVSNAIKYRDKNRALSVEVSSSEPATAPEELGLKSDQQYYKVLVADNGIGFDADLKEKVFVMFQRLHGRKEYEGTGIGLAICRKIAERHGGAIIIESVKAGVGTIFAVYLPALTPEQYQQGQTQQPDALS